MEIRRQCSQLPPTFPTEHFSSFLRIRRTIQSAPAGPNSNRQIRDAIVDDKARIGVCSFSEVCDYEMMWAHYADKFAGICVAYSLSRLLRHLDSEAFLVRMFYDETVPTAQRTSKIPEREDGSFI